MRPLRSLFNLWMCSLYFLSAALGQDLVPQVITSDLNQDTTRSLYPIYILLNTEGHWGSNSSQYVYPSNITFKQLKNDANAAWTRSHQEQFFKALCDQQSFDYCYLSDIATTYRYTSGVSTAYYTDHVLLVDINRTVSLSHFGSTETRNIDSYFNFFSVRGCVYYRLTDLDDTYDVFYYLYLAPATYNGVGVASWYCADLVSSSGDYTFFPTSNMVSTSGVKTYQITGQMRVELNASSYQILQNDDAMSLPFWQQGSTITFCAGLPNYYWNSYGSVDKDSTDYPTFSTYNFSNSVVNTSNWPFYERIRFITAASSYYLDEFVSFPNLERLDSDNGGMSDYSEWYQTKHDLLDPDDDEENTEEIDDEKPLPPPEEGETVVDVGKDTVDRYGRYWDDQVGDDEALDNITPPTLDSLPSPAPYEFYLGQVTTPLQQEIEDSLSDHEFKPIFDGAFSPLGVSDNQFSWTINPSINSSWVNMSLPSVTIAPATWIQDPTYGPYFQSFRSCLLLVEFLYFVFKLYKLVVSSLAGGSASVDAGAEDD